MPRPKRCRVVCRYPRCMSFAPDEEASRGHVILALDEYETIRLIDLEGLTQLECAQKMQVSRTTVTDIYDSARRKIADCLVHGKQLVIAGGDYRLEQQELQLVNIGTKKGSHTMRVAVTYENGEVFQHFGHTRTFKLYDITDGKVTSSELLQSSGEGHGALAGLLKTAAVDALICGGIGGGAQMALAQEGIALYAGVTGSADAAAEALARGTLVYSTEANCSHHGEGHSCGNHDHGCGSHGCHH
jgi:predicted DNA-binding protein (UPF0251 family)/predicted Fe-Mo cluster-binding NifX family protein